MAELNEITSIEKLVETLNKKNNSYSYLDVLKAIDIDPVQFEKYYTWKEDRYTRNCVSRNDDYELLVICWEKEQQSPIHDYDFREAWVHPLRGRILEERFREFRHKKLELVSSVILGVNEFSYLDQITIHRFKNIFDSRSVSLHLYSTPVQKWRVYHQDTGETEVKSLSYDSYEGEII